MWLVPQPGPQQAASRPMKLAEKRAATSMRSYAVRLEQYMSSPRIHKDMAFKRKEDDRTQCGCDADKQVM